MKKRFIPLVLLLALCLALPARAHGVPDLTQNGTITFELNWQGEPVSGGVMELYRVGDIVEDNGSYTFALIPALADSGLSLETIDDPALAAKLAQLAEDAGLVPLSAPVADGLVEFTDVPPGLYVAVQPEASEGFAALSPFLISMPRFSDGTYVTDVVARPKVPLVPETTEPTEPSDPTEPTGPDIPQTGQLNWPVPLLAAMGLGFFAMGWVLCFGRKRGNRDA